MKRVEMYTAIGEEAMDEIILKLVKHEIPCKSCQRICQMRVRSEGYIVQCTHHVPVDKLKR